MTNNESDISTKIVQNGKETAVDTVPETSWVPKNPPPAALKLNAPLNIIPKTVPIFPIFANNRVTQ